MKSPIKPIKEAIEHMEYRKGNIFKLSGVCVTASKIRLRKGHEDVDDIDPEYIGKPIVVADITFSYPEDRKSETYYGCWYPKEKVDVVIAELRARGNKQVS